VLKPATGSVPHGVRYHSGSSSTMTGFFSCSPPGASAR
jgi:hypothetical protein